MVCVLLCVGLIVTALVTHTRFYFYLSGAIVIVFLEGFVACGSVALYYQAKARNGYPLLSILVMFPFNLMVLGILCFLLVRCYQSVN
jgi:hypothetical protein